MDSITHALLIAGMFAVIGKSELIPFAVLGAIIPDVDTVFMLFSDGSPDLYLFTHGGITHSILGAAVVATLAATAAYVIIQTGLFKNILPPVPLALVLGAAVLGSMSHIFIDFLAYPGIPLLFPLTDTKMTMGVLGGPSALLVVASVLYGAFMLFGKASIERPGLFFAVFAIVVLLSAGMKLYAAVSNDSFNVIPGIDPSKYIVVKESPDAYRVYEYSFFKGPTRENVYEKYKGISPSEINGLDSSEYKRFRYHSYITVVEKNGNGIVWSDPLRTDGYVWYPPYFKSLNMTS